MTRAMCDGCSIQKNKEQWANYPHMLELCKLCQSFQDAISKTISEAEERRDIWPRKK